MGRRKQFTAEQLKKRAAERMRKWRLDNPQRAKDSLVLVQAALEYLNAS